MKLIAVDVGNTSTAVGLWADGKVSRVAHVDGSLDEAAARIRALQATVPFAYEVLLADEDLVRQRQEQLNAQIEALKECVKEYEELWNNGK